MSRRTCFHCAHLRRPVRIQVYREMMSWWIDFPVCVNHPDAPGQIKEVHPAETCPNFTPRRQLPQRPEPPEPPSDDVRYIPLTKGLCAMVDAADYEELSKYKWHVVSVKKPYAARKEGGKTIYMHRQIMQPPEGMMVDHINGFSLNNRRANLRICTNQQNMQNIRKSPRAGSRFKGVYYDKRRRT
jgi:hypothetical protein